MARAKALVVSPSKGQVAVNLARSMCLIDHSMRIHSTRDELCIPLIRAVDEAESRRLSLALGQFRIEEREFIQRQLPHQTLVEVLQDRLAPSLLAAVPRSLDVVGGIAIVELPDELRPYDKLIGRAIMETLPSVRTVMAKAGSFSTQCRVRELRLIAGEDNSVTQYRENGCLFELDVKTVYFSPRLGHERMRIASQVQPGETVVDMFAGVGPYSILIAKRQPTSTVYAVDVNPSAFKFLIANILVNRVLGNVRPMRGDIREVVRSSLSGTADRVVMNLPGDAVSFIDEACTSLKKGGGVVHFYSFESAETPAQAATAKLEEAIRGAGRKMKLVLATRVVKAVAPYRVQVAVDAVIN
jgi:tRNA (guanine37-N1)-methyltransferase